MSVDPVLTEAHVSNRVLGGALAYLDTQWSPETVDAIVEGCGLSRGYIDDRERWISVTFQNRLNDAINAEARRRTEAAGGTWDDAAWARLWTDMGEYGWQPDVLGPLYAVVRGIGSPGRVYRQLPRLTAQANRTLSFEILEDRPGRIVLAVSAAEGFAPLSRDIAWNIGGMAGSLPAVWGLPHARVGREVEEDDGELTAVRLCIDYVDTGAGAWPFALGGLVLGGAVAWWVGPAWGLAAAACGLGVYGIRRARRAESVLTEEAMRMTRIFEQADARYDQLWAEEQELRRSLLASKKLSGYLAGDLVERILANPEVELTLGGRRVDAAVLFADIVGFTPRCEKLTPEQVIDELNLYFSFIDPAFHTHDGIIDKRMGDGVMGVFVPRDGESAGDVRGRAVRCALDMLRAIPEVNRALAERGGAPFAIRVGIAAGPLVQGNIGSPYRLEYSVIGDVVNLAARLEGAAEPGSLLVAEDALPDSLEALGAHEELGRRTIRVKGKSAEISVVGLRPR